MMNPPRKRSQSLAHELVSELTRSILLGKIGPGEKLPSESAIVRQFGVSRTVVREAISRLQASGLVETRHGVGSFVLQQQERSGVQLTLESKASVCYILELRMGVEVQAVALAAERRTRAQLESMRQALEEYQDALAAGRSAAQADCRFHLLIADATANPFYQEIMQHLSASIIPRELVKASYSEEELVRHGYLANLEHEAIFKAIRQQNVDAARASMWLHLINSMERLTGDAPAAAADGGD